MTTVPAKQNEQPTPATIEDVLFRGNLADLTPSQRTFHVMDVCKSLGLNWRTRPFQYLTLSGKLVLYATRDCTDQLRTLHSVSVEDLTNDEREGVYVVTAKVRNKDGRTDIATGAVNIGGLKGETLANALMKAETKAKRRATLSICGLGFLDETEVGDTQETPGTITDDQHKNLLRIAKEVGADLPQFLEYLSVRFQFDVDRLIDIPASHYDDALAQLERKRTDKKKIAHDPETGEVTDANT
jgi:hypothetical protein